MREGDNQSPNSANPSSSVFGINILQNALDSKGKSFKVEYSKVVDLFQEMCNNDTENIPILIKSDR